MKLCVRCHKVQMLDNFYAMKTACDGKSSYCKSCHIAMSSERTERARATPEGRARYNGYAKISQRRQKLRKLGIPESDIPRLIEEAEAGRCHACNRRPDELDIPVESAKRLHVDHDHETNLYRGLLCQHCNSALGLVGDDIERLQALINYLTRHQSASQDIAMLGGQT